VRKPEASLATVAPRSESVRDIQFDPRNEFVFASAFENGTLQVRSSAWAARSECRRCMTMPLSAQIWDTRRLASPVIRHAAHNALVLALQYHPDFDNVIATGGRDRIVKVWCGVVWCGVVWCGVVWCGVVWCGVVCAAVRCGAVRCGAQRDR
jgi:WD40 repeat protein